MRRAVQGVFVGMADVLPPSSAALLAVLVLYAVYNEAFRLGPYRAQILGLTSRVRKLVEGRRQAGKQLCGPSHTLPHRLLHSLSLGVAEQRRAGACAPAGLMRLEQEVKQRNQVKQGWSYPPLSGAAAVMRRHKGNGRSFELGPQQEVDYRNLCLTTLAKLEKFALETRELSGVRIQIFRGAGRPEERTIADVILTQTGFSAVAVQEKATQSSVHEPHELSWWLLQQLSQVSHTHNTAPHPTGAPT